MATRRRGPLFALSVVLVLVLISVGGFTWWRDRGHAEPQIDEALATPDPGLGKTVGRAAVGRAGRQLHLGTTRITVPAGAVPSGSITVASLTAPGRVAAELFGPPVRVDHSRPLHKALTVRWTLPRLTVAQQRTLVLAKWDPGTRAWVRKAVPFTVHGRVLTARLHSFSAWDWIANAGQKVGELTGTRASAPRCSGKPLPAWVDGTVNTDEDSKAAAVLTCFEPDPNHGSVVTVHVTNNRTFAQQLTLKGAKKWAWTWSGGKEPPLGFVYDVAHHVFDTVLGHDQTFLVPPLTETTVGIDRPSQPGSQVVSATAHVNAATVFADVTAWAVGQVPAGGSDNPVLNAYLEVLYECGGKSLLTDDPRSAGAALRAAVDTIKGCVGQLTEPDSAAADHFEQLARTAIDDEVSDAGKARVAKEYRLVSEVSRFMKVLDIGELGFYVSDQIANAVVGPLTFSVRGRGMPQKLGDWTPSCQRVATDANALYKNLALQDEFADSHKDLWQFSGWQAAAGRAVQPLRACSAGYDTRLADALPGAWADRKAATIVADQIRALLGAAAGGGSDTGSDTSGASPRPSARSFAPGSAFDDSCVIAWPTAPTYTAQGVQMTMSCGHVPESTYLFTTVFVADPTLRPTPATGAMRVVGTVVGTARSGYGFTMLEVRAASVTP